MEPTKKGIKLRQVVVWGIVIALLALTGVRVVQVLQSRSKQAAGRAIQNAAPGFANRSTVLTTVRTQPVQLGTVEELSVLSGTLEPSYQVDITARRSGRVESVRAQVGSRVQAGEVLGTVEHRDLLLQEKQMEANLAASQASLRRTELQREKAYNDYLRVENLYKQKAATEQELNNVTNQLREIDLQLEGAKAQLEQVKANSEILDLQLSQVKIDTPVAGVLVSSSLTVGSQLNSSAAVARVAGIDPIQVVFSIPEREVSRLALNQELSITVDAYPQKQFAGRVTQLGAVIDPQTRSLKVTGSVANPKLELQPGMYAKVELVMGKDVQKPTIPREALLANSSGFYVFVVNDDKVSQRPIKVGIQGKQLVSVTSGLSVGELVVTVGQQGLRDGQTVRTVGAEKSSRPPGAGNGNSRMAPQGASAGSAPTGAGNGRVEPQGGGRQ